MDEKKIVTTESELVMLIGCASAMDVEEKGLPEDMCVDHACSIAHIVTDHLSGRKKIPEVNIKMYQSMKLALDTMIALFGVGTGSPGNVEEDNDGKY